MKLTAVYVKNSPLWQNISNYSLAAARPAKSYRIRVTLDKMIKMIMIDDISDVFRNVSFIPPQFHLIGI